MKFPYETPEMWFHAMGTHFVAAQVNFHLNQAGVFNAIYENGPSSAAEIAGSLKLDEKILSCLLEYVSSVDGLLEHNNGKFSFNAFGAAVLKRYGREENGRMKFNFLDVRIGAYGNVWQGLEGMLTGELRYGENLKRDGRFAEDGVFKSAGNFIPGITKAISGLPTDGTLIELGVNSGLIERMAGAVKFAHYAGVDRSKETIEKSKTREGADKVTWLAADLSDLDKWAANLPTAKNAVIFSIHFHEFMALGEKEVGTILKALRTKLPGSSVLVLEQPKPVEADRDKVSETLWSYSHSNVLIHHLIGNGKILTAQGWIDLFQSAGWKLTKNEATGYLGYRAFLFSA